MKRLRNFFILCFAFFAFAQTGFGQFGEVSYDYAEYPLTRNGIDLHLDRVALTGEEPGKDILLIHGVTYSSHEFDVDYKDYSLVRRLAREGYAVWRLDIAGFGRSEEVEDGFMPDSEYAAEDIATAAETILRASGRERLDVLGWSWGTITVARFASARPELIDKIVLYAPILSGIGEYDVKEPFHHNTWVHSIEDFQKREDGTLDYSITEKTVIDVWCSNCWRYDGDSSPNGGRRDACVDKSVELIDLTKTSNPTLMIYGDADPYLDLEKLAEAAKLLPKGSEVEIIRGGSHAIMLEKPFYRAFQEKVIRFLRAE